MKYKKQVTKALQGLSAWGEDHWVDMFIDVSDARYRAFIEKVDKDFDYLCNQILFALADAIVGHRRIMMDSGQDYFGDYVHALGERPWLDELDNPERFNHGSGNADLPNPEYLQETMSELFEWAAAKLEEMTAVQNIDNYNRFMADLDVSFEALLKWHEIYDLDAMVPLLNNPAKKWRPFLENVDEMFDYNGPETWVVTLDLSRCHAAPERLQ
ncbi:MAG: hypothetical protein M0003_13215 [Acidithiobacillus sp.]|nr:hypothetical protein [Acidithiobacillus sp.]